jgi:hypothetical protein
MKDQKYYLATFEYTNEHGGTSVINMAVLGPISEKITTRRPKIHDMKEGSFAVMTFAIEISKEEYTNVLDWSKTQV